MLILLCLYDDFLKEIITIYSVLLIYRFFAEKLLFLAKTGNTEKFGFSLKSSVFYINPIDSIRFRCHVQKFLLDISKFPCYHKVKLSSFCHLTDALTRAHSTEIFSFQGALLLFDRSLPRPVFHFSHRTAFCQEFLFVTQFCSLFGKVY